MILTIMAQAAAPLAAFDNARFLSAIVAVEGHAWSDAGGAYAIMPATWSDYSTRPYAFASLKQYADDVASRHIAWLSRTLRTEGYPVNAYTLACCWRFGYSGFVRRIKAGGGAIQYGERVWNLYQDSNNNQKQN